MNDREAAKQDIAKISNKNILIELPTGYGKTALALEVLKARIPLSGKVLVVVPRLVLIKNFLHEVKLWWKECKISFTFTTYVSLKKHHGNWDAVIFDEVHHLTPKCREELKNINSKTSILLSATISKKMKEILQSIFIDLGHYKRTIKEAITTGVLPNPQVYLIPLNLDNTIYSEVIVKNPKCLNSIDVLWKDRWKYLARKDVKINIKCTKRQFMLDLDGQIQWWKNKYLQTRKDVFKNKWLRLCNDRLKILSNWRTDNTLEILKYFKNYRTLTFCNSIEHTEVLGKYCINSKNRSCSEILASFNAGKIKHITACNMLNEGINLSDCRIGIYAVLNSSEILIKQKLGRILRHEKPIVIIPYYKNTREEEIVNNNMLLEYDPKLVKIIKSVNEIVL